MSAVMCQVLPESRGSEACTDLRSTPRRTSLVWKTSQIALTRSSPFACIAIASPDHLMDASVPLKSKRWPTSRAAWLSALSTSCRSTLLTMSKELSDAMLQSCQHLLAIALACGWRRPSLNRAQPRRQGPSESGCRYRACAQFRESGRVGSHPSAHDGRASFAKTGHSAIVIPRWSTAMAACPSGQRERSVKPSATPTMVRIHQLPRKDPVDSSTGSLILLAVIERSCSRPA